MTRILADYWPVAVFVVLWAAAMSACAISVRNSNRRIKAANEKRAYYERKTADLLRERGDRS